MKRRKQRFSVWQLMPRKGLRRYLGKYEQVLLITRQHPLALVRATIETSSLVFPLVVTAWGVAGTELLRGAVGTWLLRILFAVMFILMLRLVWSVISWEFERVLVTDEKVIYVSGVLDRQIASTPINKVSEFTVRQPLLGRIFDYGSLIVDIPGGRHQALHGILFLPDPTGVYRLICEQTRNSHRRLATSKSTEDLEIRIPMPLDKDIDRLQRETEIIDPQLIEFEGDQFDHTIQIPRVKRL